MQVVLQNFGSGSKVQGNPAIEYLVFSSKKGFHSYIFMLAIKKLTAEHKFEQSLKMRFSGVLLYS